MSTSSTDMDVSTEDLQIPFDRLAKFVRQVSHDVRNNLGSIDLQAAYIAELVVDPEVAGELKKLRGMVASAAKTLQTTSANFWMPRANLVPLDAGIFLEDFRDRLLKLFPEDMPEMEWQVALTGAQIALDLELLFTALSEFCRNAFYFHETTQPIAVLVTAEDGKFVFELREKRVAVDTDPASWGRAPLVSTRRGGYGLGLFHARQILSVHGGEVSFTHDPARSLLTTRISLPLAPALENGR